MNRTQSELETRLNQIREWVRQVCFKHGQEWHMQFRSGMLRVAMQAGPYARTFWIDSDSIRDYDWEEDLAYLVLRQSEILYDEAGWMMP